MTDALDLLITGARVIDADGEARAEIGVRDGRICALLPPGEPATAGHTIDATGCVLLPGLVDAHAHLREPGLTQKEDFSSGTHAAALGGVTTVLDMPTDDPWTATAAQLAAKMQLATGRIHVDVGFQAVLTAGFAGLDALLALAPVSVEIFTADVPDAFLFPAMDALAEALRRLRGADTLAGISPGDQSILTGTAARDASGAIAAFLASRPPLAEAQGVARAILAAAATGARVHVRQINSALGVETWRRLRGMADASVETTPQNLLFTAQDYERDGARLKASPPFRAPQDRDALRAALAEGLIDIAATDHAPHAPAEKHAAYPAFADIPGGMAGLQTLLPTLLRLVDEGVIGLRDIARLAARNPAERFGLGRRKGRIAPGLDADILVLAMDETSQIKTADQVSKAGTTPFDGWTVQGRLRRVLLRGVEIVRDGRLVSPARGSVVVRNG